MSKTYRRLFTEQHITLLLSLSFLRAICSVLSFSSLCELSDLERIVNRRHPFALNHYILLFLFAVLFSVFVLQRCPFLSKLLS